MASPARAPVARFSVPLPGGQSVLGANAANLLALSPDGTRIVYVADGVRFLTSAELVQDAGTFFAGHPIPQAALQLQQQLERQRVNSALRERVSDELSEAFAT